MLVLFGSLENPLSERVLIPTRIIWTYVVSVIYLVYTGRSLWDGKSFALPGEPEFIERMSLEYHDKAIAAGVTIVSAAVRFH